MNFDDVRTIALAWPGVEDAISYGSPSLKVKGKLLTRLKEDGDSLVVKGVNPDEREMLIEAEPDIYYVTEHYIGWPIVLVRLSKANPIAVERLLLRCWREIAPKALARKFDERGDGSP